MTLPDFRRENFNLKHNYEETLTDFSKPNWNRNSSQKRLKRNQFYQMENSVRHLVAVDVAGIKNQFHFRKNFNQRFETKALISESIQSGNIRQLKRTGIDLASHRKFNLNLSLILLFHDYSPSLVCRMEVPGLGIAQ